MVAFSLPPTSPALSELTSWLAPFDVVRHLRQSGRLNEADERQAMAHSIWMMLQEVALNKTLKALDEAQRAAEEALREPTPPPPPPPPKSKAKGKNAKKNKGKNNDEGNDNQAEDNEEAEGERGVEEEIIAWNPVSDKLNEEDDQDAGGEDDRQAEAEGTSSPIPSSAPRSPIPSPLPVKIVARNVNANGQNNAKTRTGSGSAASRAVSNSRAKSRSRTAEKGKKRSTNNNNYNNNNINNNNTNNNNNNNRSTERKRGQHAEKLEETKRKKRTSKSATKTSRNGSRGARSKTASPDVSTSSSPAPLSVLAEVSREDLIADAVEGSSEFSVMDGLLQRIIEEANPTSDPAFLDVDAKGSETDEEETEVEKEEEKMLSTVMAERNWNENATNWIGREFTEEAEGEEGETREEKEENEEEEGNEEGEGDAPWHRRNWNANENAKKAAKKGGSKKALAAKKGEGDAQPKGFDPTTYLAADLADERLAALTQSWKSLECAYVTHMIRVFAAFDSRWKEVAAFVERKTDEWKQMAAKLEKGLELDALKDEWLQV